MQMDLTLLTIVNHIISEHPELAPSIARISNNPVSDKWKTLIRQREEFERIGGVVTHQYPIFGEDERQAGVASGHYFHQDLLVASLINIDRPKRHIDVSSRVDGFVAHVAAFREIEVADIRYLPRSVHSNILFRQIDAMIDLQSQLGYTDSISSLHALEHFGLGRYGDQLDPHGHLKGFRNLVSTLSSGGKLYVSFPIGMSNEVHFNAHRVFHPLDIFNWPTDPYTITLERFDFVDDNGDLVLNFDLSQGYPCLRHGCGIYTFRKA